MFAARAVAVLSLFLAPALAAQEAAARGPLIGEAELAPYFAGGVLQKAAAELQAGHAAAALKLIPAKPKDAPAQWLRAIALKNAGQTAASRRLFEQLALDGGPLADRALHYAGLAALDGGDARGAERLLAQVPARYVDADQAMLERARQLMHLRIPGPKTAALIEQVLQPIFEGEVRADSAAAYLVAGDAWRDAGDKEKARERYRAAWIDRPLSGAAESARQRERALGLAGTPIAPERLVRRAELLLDAHRNREALDQLSHISLPSLCTVGCPGDHTAAGILQAALEALGAGPEQHQPTPEDVARTPVDPANPLSCRAKLDQGRALRKEHDYAKARAVLAPVVLRCADPDIRARALFLLAQLESMAGKPNAAPLWKALADNFPKSSLADDALFNQALALRRTGGNVDGERALLKRLVEQQLDSDMRAEALFRLFWSFFVDAKARQGLVWLDQLAALPDPEGVEEERARYWRARVLLEPQPGASEQAKAAEREAALADLTWLVESRPLTYHGLLARGRLMEVAPQRAQAIANNQERQVVLALTQAPPPLHAGSLARDPHFAAAVELLRLGLTQEAIRELAAIDRAPLRAAQDIGYEPLTLLADLYSRAGDPRNAHALVRTELRPLLRRPAEPLAMRAASLAYPLAFRDQIAKVAQTAGIPPDLLQALMREESALDPRALSPTGALGLTQLMPSTARAVAHKLKLRGYQTMQLLEPTTNIRIGGTYLGELMARFQHPALALAGYNAGPTAVAGWVRSRGTMPLDVFVEEIPLDETRGYVKRCLRSFAAYQFLYGRGEGRAPQLGQTLAARG